MTSTKTHSTGQVAFARCTFWQLHQINLLSSLRVKSTSSLILAWKGCNYPLIMKTAVYQARQQGAKWTCWIWITPDVWLRTLSSPQCTHGCAWTDELPPLAWLLPFFHGRWVWADTSWTCHKLPQTTELQRHVASTSSEVGCSFSQCLQGNLTQLPVCLCSRLTSTSRRCRQSPPLDKVQPVCYSSVTLWDRGRIKKNPEAATNTKSKQDSAFCSVILPGMSLKTLLFFSLLM